MDELVRETLRAKRTEAGLSQADVARQVGITQAAYSWLERGINRPSLPVAMRIAALLHSSVEEIFPDVEGQHGS